MGYENSKSPDLVESFSGIRGIYGKGITESLAFKYAISFAKNFCKKEDILVIAGDTRPSTKSLKQAMVKGFSYFGVKEIIDLGVLPVQVAEYAVLHFKARGGVYITASHNEPEYNGWKFLKEDGAILYPEQSEKLVASVYENKKMFEILQDYPQNDKLVELHNFCVDKHIEAIDAYVSYLLKKIGEDSLRKIRESKFKILFDPNGGSSIELLEQIAKEFNLEKEIINDKPGEFNRLIEPKAESLKYLEEKIKVGNFDFACGFDCDADRMEIVLPQNSVFAKKMGTPNVSGNYVLALACDAVLNGTNGQVVPTNDVTSYLVRDVIKKHNATTQEVEVGEINVVGAIEKNNSIIGGEGSCAGIIVPPVKCRDGIITVALVLKLMADKSKKLDEILNDYPEYFSDRAKMSCLPENAINIRRKIGKYFEEKGWAIMKTGDETGGLKAHPDANSYVWFRQSKTEPGAFRIYVECDGSQEKAKKLLEEGIFAFEKFK